MVTDDHTPEYLLGFDGRVHWYENGYHLRFRISRAEPVAIRPHGLRYSFTLHDPAGRRLLGFDNAHSLRIRGGRRKLSKTADHWHRTVNDAGFPYAFKDAAALLNDFFDAVETVLAECGVRFDEVVRVDEKESPP